MWQTVSFKHHTKLGIEASKVLHNKSIFGPLKGGKSADLCFFQFLVAGAPSGPVVKEMGPYVSLLSSYNPLTHFSLYPAEG